MNTQPEQHNIFFNGINGDSGQYDLPPMSGEDLSDLILRQSPAENLADLRKRFAQSRAKHAGLEAGVDPTKLEEAGWGVIFTHDADPAVEEALTDLLERRRQQAGQYFHIFKNNAGFRRGRDTKEDFLARHGVGPGPAVPAKVPYYLLIVGSPDAIPYRFQSQLDVQYAVGRLHFDTPQEYANYARSVVASETGAVTLPREVAYFGVANGDDPSTQLSAAQLIQPLRDQLSTKTEDWNHTTILPEAATKTRLTRLLGGDQAPALLFTASHGMSFPLDSPRQLAHQGALLCQDWPGPQKWAGQGPIPQDFYFAADDLPGDANLSGQIALFFACYSAGTPLDDDFAKQAFRDRSAIAPHPFLAQLPQKMLAHPRGGALATIGHVERTWGYSFTWPEAGSQTAVFESTLHRLLNGHPVGLAVEYLNVRYAELATLLSDELEKIDFGDPVDPYKLAGLWTANNDARGYAIIGDPAVRLPLGESDPEEQQPPALTVQLPGDEANETAAPPSAALPDLEKLETLTIGAETAPLPQPAADDDLKTVTIETYTSTDLDDPDGRQLLIKTRITLDGKGETVLSTASAELDPRLIALHQAIVKEAIAARLAYLKLLATADEPSPDSAT
jgi:hypothetical protein